MQSVGDVTLWSVFSLVVAIVFGIDFFFVGGRKDYQMRLREAGYWIGIWAGCAILFGLFLWYHLSPLLGAVMAKQKTLEFFTGYLIEESLSVDNMFVILVIFQSFAVPLQWQRRVLLWGVMGAIILRFLVIFAGIWLVKQFHWILYFFGALLMWSGGKIFFVTEKATSPAENRFLQWVTQYLRVTKTFHAERFFVKQNQIWFVTPLFLALILVEVNDLIFALDSIPAVFSVTLDRFIVITSNIFAILGLRALYFIVAHLANRFDTLKYGIAIILILAGGKMLAQPWVTFSILPMLLTVITILLVTGFIGWMKEKGK